MVVGELDLVGLWRPDQIGPREPMTSIVGSNS